MGSLDFHRASASASGGSGSPEPRPSFRFGISPMTARGRVHRAMEALLATVTGVAFMWHPNLGITLEAYAALLVCLAYHVFFLGGASATTVSRGSALSHLLIRVSMWTVCVVVAGMLVPGTIEMVNAYRELPATIAVPALTAFIYRALVDWVAARTRESSCRKAVIVGATPVGREIFARARATTERGLHIQGFFDFRAASRVQLPSGARLLGGIDMLVEYVERENVGLVIIALPMRDEARIREVVDRLKDSAATVAFVPDLLQFDLIQSEVWDLSGIPVMTLQGSPIYGPAWIAKQVFDYVGSAILIVLLSPLLLAIAAAIKLTSRGPVIFKQRRHGLDGAQIIVYKFRTMYEQGGSDFTGQTMRHDPRVTPLGRFLRRLSLDELPQLFNVLEGTMSLVGPRPHAVDMNAEYRKVINGYALRHKVKPGITGWAQVNGLRGPADDRMMRARILHDEFYLRNWSLGLDIMILLRTAAMAWRDKNAL